jgi:hypothetical protein
MYTINSPYIDHNVSKHYNPNWQFNSLGFRGREFDISKRNILIAGCSVHFGFAVDDHENFPNLLIDQLGEEYGYLNVSMPGTGIDAQIKNITWALSNFKFEKLLWLSSHPARALYYHETQGALPFCPGAPPMYTDHWFDSVQGRAWTASRIVNDYDTAAKATDAAETLFLLLNALNVDSYVKNWVDNYDIHMLSPLKSKYKIQSLPNFLIQDTAQDNLHAGVKSHAVYADNLYKLLKPSFK